MIEFLDLQDVAHYQIEASYNVPLVAVSYVVASMAAFSATRLAGYAEYEWRYNWRWLIAGGVTMGFGVWAMHFIGMLAYRLSMPVTYDIYLTAFSVLPSIIGCSLGLALLRRGLRLHITLRRVLAGTIIGAGIGIMHYTGMEAMRMNAFMFYDQRWFILSILIAVILGIVGVYAEKLRDIDTVQWRRLPYQIASAAIFGLAVTGMHYVAMLAVIPVDVVRYGPADQHIITPVVLALNVTVASLIITGLALLASVVDAKMKASDKLVKVTQARMFAAIESISDGFLLFDEHGTLLLYNAIFSGMYPSLKPVLKPGSSYETILRAWAKGRKTFPDDLDRDSYIQKCLIAFKMQTQAVQDIDEDELFDGRWAIIRQNPVQVGGLVGVWHDVTAIKKQQDIYKELAMTDGLTKLPNRPAFLTRLANALKRNKRHKKKVALMFIDLDKFKPINDSYGHDAGDHVLCVIADRLSALMRETDLVARIGGDEFVVILEQISSYEDLEKVAQKILDHIKAPIEYKNHDCSVGASIGISVSPDHGDDEDALIKLADDTMYAVKEGGRNNYRIYRHETRDTSVLKPDLAC